MAASTGDMASSVVALCILYIIFITLVVACRKDFMRPAVCSYTPQR